MFVGRKMTLFIKLSVLARDLFAMIKKFITHTIIAKTL